MELSILPEIDYSGTKENLVFNEVTSQARYRDGDVVKSWFVGMVRSGLWSLKSDCYIDC